MVSPNESDGFQVHKVGEVIDSTAAPLAFGAAADFRFENTSYELDPATGKPVFSSLDIASSFYTKNSDSRLMVETHPDGSRTLALVSVTLVDATGKPR